MKYLKEVLCVFLLIGNVQAKEISYKIYPNGSFDLIGSKIEIKSCYPAINNILIRPLAVKITSNKIDYKLENGSLKLEFVKEGNYTVIKTSTTLPKDYAFNISPIFQSVTQNAEKIYKTASAIMGEGGIKKWPNNEVLSSAILSGIIPDSGNTLIISFHDIKKYFSNIEFGKYKNEKIVNVTIQTEKVLPTYLPNIYLSESKVPYEGMRYEAQVIGNSMNARLDKPQAYLWCSWYYTFNYLTEKMLSEYLDGFETITPRIPLQAVQIDAGYHPHIGDWLEKSDKFPNGIEPSIKEIIKKGYNAGIWIAPYMVGNRSKLYKEHPEWVMKWGDGSKVRFYDFYDEQRLFGTLDEEYYSLDTSNPEVMEYLRQVFRAFKKMGINYFKTDFMIWGDQQSQNLKRVTPGKTSIEYQREFFDMIRQEIGPESFWLGCIAPFTPMIGYVDGMRVSADITAKWQGAESMFEETKGSQHINNVWWQNDPDAMILRSKFNKMTNQESNSINLWMGLLGGMINTSEVLNELPKDRLELFRSLEPNNVKTTAYFPLINTKSEIDIMVKELKSNNMWLVLAVNRTETDQKAIYSLNSIIDKQKLFVSLWKEGIQTESGEVDKLNFNLKSHESVLYIMSTSKDAAKKYTLGGKEIGK